MDAKTPGTTPPVPNAPILKRRKAKKIAETKYWNGMLPLGVGLAIGLAGGLITMTVSGGFGKIVFLIGFLLTIFGLAVESYVLVYRLIKER